MPMANFVAKPLRKSLSIVSQAGFYSDFPQAECLLQSENMLDALAPFNQIDTPKSPISIILMPNYKTKITAKPEI